MKERGEAGLKTIELPSIHTEELLIDLAGLVHVSEGVGVRLHS